MKEITEDKGRVRPVVEGDFQCDENGNSTRVYEILSIVGIVDSVGKLSYISKKNVPVGIPITDEEYWYPFQVIAVPKGDKGDDGKSAYDLYIEHGGTIAPVEEWLESLHGADGKDAISPILRISPDGSSIEISSDNGQTWLPFQKDFNKLRVLGYVESVAQLPVSANIGDIYGVWNQQAQSGAGAYELYINTVRDWTLEYTITKVYDYDTELPSSATDGTTVLVPVTDLTLDKEKVDGYKVYRFSLADNGWIMILNTAEIYASKDDIVSHGDNKYALVQGEGSLTETKLRENTVVSKKDYCRIVNMTDNSLMLIIVQDSKRMFHSIGTGAYMLPNNCGVYLVNDSSVTDDIVIAPSMHVSEATHISNLEYMPEGIYPYYILTESSVGDIYITPESKLTPNESEEQEGLTVETKTTTLLSFKQTYELYKRVVDWVYFGTNASIAYHLVQNVQEGSATNILSGKATKDAINAEIARATNAEQYLNNIKADKEEGKGLIPLQYIQEVENPEFIRVYLDANDKILWGIQHDGNIYYGAGCPQQVKDYIQEQVDDIMGAHDVTEAIDSVKEIIAFLETFTHDETLADVLYEMREDYDGKINAEKERAQNAENGKQDKEEGRGLIDTNVAEGIYYVENPEFAGVWLDNEEHILFGVQTDGNFLFGCGVPQQVKGYIEEKISSLSLDEYEDIVAFLSDYLGSDTTLKAIIGEWNNAVPGRKISILGDSISTFNQEGYKIDGYAMYYPTAAGDRGADVTTVNDTWWMQVINSIEGVLEVNASYSGSTASSRTVGFSPRVPLLGNPDIIYIALGTNDSGKGVTVGEINFEAETYDLTQFAPAYIKGMQDTIAAYPKAKIVCVAFDMGADYQNAIKIIAEHYGAEYIYVGDISDVHPNKAEMTAAANRITEFSTFTITDAFKGLSAGKVDKEESKSLINAEFAEGVSQIENPEFAEVHNDANDKVLYGVKQDGDFYFGAGVPSQIKEKLDKKANLADLDEVSAEVAEVAEIAANKVDKEEGKSLIDSEYASTKSTIDNPEFLDVTIDNENKVLEGIKVDGTKVIGRNLKVLGNMEVSEVSYKVIENTEYLAAWVDAENKVIFGLKADGKTYIGDADFLDDIEDIKAFLTNITDKDIDWDALSSITATENPEYINIVTDSENKILAGRTPDGAAFENVGFTTPKVSIDGATIENIKDPERRSEIITDSEGNIISYRDSDGVKHEEVEFESKNIKTDNLNAKSVNIFGGNATLNSLNLTNEGMNEFQQALKDSGFRPGGAGDWSDYISNDGDSPLYLPIPKFAIINFSNLNGDAVWPTSKEADYEYYMEYWDMQGNYFKKNILMNDQGNSSRIYPKKNGSIDLFDASVYDKKGRKGKGDVFKIRFGEWVPQDSFHLKAFYNDFFKGGSFIVYQLADDVAHTYDSVEDRPWKKGIIGTYTGTGESEIKQINDMSLQIDNGARCMPDGFPTAVYLNGEFHGLYVFALKKHRDNYHMEKKNGKHIHLDGTSFYFFNGTIGWGDFEVRNPKDSEMCSTIWDEDSGAYLPYKVGRELLGDDAEHYDSSNKSHVLSNKVKRSIEALSNRLGEANALSTVEEKKAYIEQYFDVDSILDYILVATACQETDGGDANWQWVTYDGVKWFICNYDKDRSFGSSTDYLPNAITQGSWMYSNNNLLGFFTTNYDTELRARWNQYVAKGIFTYDNIFGKFLDWTKRIGQSNYEKEYAKWDEAPCNRDNKMDDEHWSLITKCARWWWWATYKKDAYVYSVENDYKIYKALKASNNKDVTNTEYWEEVTFDSEQSYQAGDICGYGFHFGADWYTDDGFYAFEAKTNVPTNTPPITGVYTLIPRVMGYRDNIWRLSNWIKQTLQTIGDFVNNN